MERVYELVSRVAPSSASVLITGESGTGKELVAETVHQLSRRAGSPYLVVNCGALSPTLIESELFGHERGSFTGADRIHHGYFERADGGTLFLDEVSEMPLDAPGQAAARAGGRRRRDAAGRREGAEGRRADRRRHQSRPRRQGRRGQVPRATCSIG